VSPHVGRGVESRDQFRPRRATPLILVRIRKVKRSDVAAEKNTRTESRVTLWHCRIVVAARNPGYLTVGQPTSANARLPHGVHGLAEGGLLATSVAHCWEG